MKSILADKQHFEKSQKLVEGLTKLKEMKLLTGMELNNIKLPGVIKNPFIYNDYHNKISNPGFARG